jgi:hypothetical protein
LGCNRIYLEPRGFVPTYHAATGPEMWRGFGDEPFRILSGKVKVFFFWEGAVTPELLEKFPNDVILPLRATGAPIFSLHPERAVYEGYTVSYVNLQLAHWMGFSRALLIGVDHRWIVPKDHEPTLAFTRRGPDPNHFCDQYIPEGMSVLYSPEGLRHATKAYGLAQEQYRRDQKMQVLNCTPGSALKVFPMGDWREIE